MAGNGNPDDYTAILVARGYPDLLESAIKLERILEADGAKAQASVVRKAYIRLERELLAIGREVAAFAAKAIVNEEVSSRVRPDTQGQGGARLEDFIGESHPLDAVPGSVGVNFEPVLETNVPWWWTNEEGYSGHEGREIQGFFVNPGGGAGSVPRAGGGTHPLFRPNATRGGRGIIQNPIPERRFVRAGYDEALVKWQGRIHQVEQEYIRAVERAVADAPPPLP